MTNTDRVERFLAHYADDNYDPSKAHEYYLKTRELQGNSGGSGTSSTSSRSSSTNSANAAAKKTALASEQANFKARMDELRSKATATRDSIKAKLNAFLESVKVQRPDPIEAKHVDEPKLLTIPKNITPQRKMYLQKQNAIKMRQYGDDLDAADREAAKATAVVMDKYKADQKAASESSVKARQDANGERQRVGNELKSAIANARAAYVESKKQLAAKYAPVSTPKSAGEAPRGSKAKAGAKGKAAVEAKPKPQAKAQEARAAPQAEVQTKAAADPNTMMKSKTARYY